MKNKRGNLLPKNVIFIVLNVVFLTLLVLYVSKQGNGAIVLEQSYAKNIALLIDSGIPITKMTINMKDAFDLAKKNNIAFENVVKITGNTVTVKLSSGGGYQYSFFNNVDATAYPDILPNKNYIIKINRYLSK
jgi:hypothetical protein